MQSILLLFANISYMLVLILIMTPAAILGLKLAPVSWLATFPLTVLELSGVIMAIPVTILMSRIGRKKCFILGASALTAASALLVLAVIQHSFVLFFSAMFLLGISGCIAAFYRYAAMEITASNKLGRITAIFVFIPLVSVLLAKLINHQYAFNADTYSVLFVICTVISAISLVLISLLYQNTSTEVARKEYHFKEFISVIFKPQYTFYIVASGVSSALMLLIMHSIPLYMKQMDYADAIISAHVNWHFLSMFLPALIISLLLDKLGNIPIFMVGLILYLTALVTIPTDINPMVPMILAGVAWCMTFSAISTQIGAIIKETDDRRLEGANELSIHSFNLLATFSAGLLFSIGSKSLITILGFVLMVLCLVLFIIYKSSTNKTMAQNHIQ